MSEISMDFYYVTKGGIEDSLVSIRSSIIPRIGECINIQRKSKEIYQVKDVIYVFTLIKDPIGPYDYKIGHARILVEQVS